MIDPVYRNIGRSTWTSAEQCSDDGPSCHAIWWNWSAATTSRERRRRSMCSKRRWINGERSPTTTARSPRSARGCPRRRFTASRPSTTTCSSRAGAPRARVHGHGVLRRHRGRPRGHRRGGVRAEPRRAQRGPVALAGRDGLPRLLPRGTGGARRRRHRRRDRARSSGCSPDASQPAPEPVFASLLDEPVLTRPGDWSGLRRGARRPPEAAARGGQGRRGARPRRRRLPRRRSSGSSPRKAEGERKVIVANGDEGDPGSYIDKLLMEDNPHLLLEGMALAGLRGRRRPRLHPRALRVPALEARARRRRSSEAPRGRADSRRGDFDVTVVEGAGSYVVGEETALLACLQGLRGHRLRAPAVPRRARRARHADRGQQRRDAVQHPVHRAPRRRGLPRAQPRTRPPAPSSSASTSASPGPASTRCRSG